MTGLGLGRRYEGRDRKGNLIPRKEKIDIPRREMELDCGKFKFNILVSPGQSINTAKMCKKLLKNLKEEHYGKEKQKKGYQGKSW